MKELLIVVIAAMMAEVVIPGVARWSGPKEEEADAPAVTAAAAVAPEAPDAEGAAESHEEEDVEAPESETARLTDENEELKLIVGEKELELHRLRQEQ